MTTCEAPGCDKPRGKGWRYCSAHYMRLYRKGHLELEPRLGPLPPCSVDGCEKIAKTHKRGLCGMHNERVRKYGDPHFAHARKGPGHGSWREDVTYEAMHMRLRSHRGSAAQFSCVDCGEPARHWSYDHSGRSELTSPLGPYSSDLDAYVARCVSCHKRYDLARMRT